MKKRMANHACADERRPLGRGFCVVESAIDASTLAILRAEADDLLTAFEAAGEDLLENDCMLEICSVPEDMEPRTSMERYLAWRASSGITTKAGVKRLMEQLSSLARSSFADFGEARPLLFNEHFVVKPPAAQSFRWHTDAAHQDRKSVV